MGSPVDEPGRTARSPPHSRGVPKVKIAIGIGIVLALVGLYWWIWLSGALELLGNEEALRAEVRRLGFWAPLAIVVLMAAAIVLSPIPSGPIALVAGAVFGPYLGTLYVVIGAEAGAIGAFYIARLFGYEAIKRWSRTAPLVEQLRKSRSQTWMMLIVLVSRLVPFISFDAVSYAAGLTPLAFWRFALATLAGVIPISFALAYFGREFITSDPTGMLLVAILVGGITLAPILVRLLWK